MVLRITRFPRIAGFALLVLCYSFVSPPAHAQKAVKQKPAAAVPAGESAITVDQLYEFLLAEIAAQRGEREVSAEAYADLARQTRDPAIAQRAVEVALVGRDSDLAIRATNLWLELEPDSASARQTLIALLLTSGNLKDAGPQLKRILADDPTMAGRVFMQLGGLTSRQTDKAGVLKLVTELSAGHPKLPEARFALGQAARAAEQNGLALSETDAALKLRPDWELAALLHGSVLSTTAPDDAVPFYRDFLKRNPNAREVRTGLARQLATQKDYAGARKEFEALVTAAPNSAEYALALGVLSIELKDYTAAEKHLKRALELNYLEPDTVRSYLGQLKEDQKLYPEAIAWYRQVTGGENYLATQVRVAALMAKQGDIDGGRKYLRSARAGNPEQQAQILMAEAQILRDAKQYEQAIEVLGEGIHAQPESAELLYDRAMTAEKLNRVDVMETDLRKIMVIKPENAHAYNALGYTFAERNMRLAEALQLVEKAYQLAPDDPAILDSMGWVHYRLGNLDKGLDFLRKAIIARPDPEVAAHLAEVLVARGDRGEAKSVSAKALKENPDNEALIAVVKRLDLK